MRILSKPATCNEDLRRLPATTASQISRRISALGGLCQEWPRAYAAGVITATELYNYLSCPRRVTMDRFEDPARRDPVSAFVELLWERGSLFERDTIERLSLPFLDLSELKRDEKEAATRAAMGRGEGLIYNGRLSDAELLGESDLLRREDGGYVAIDIKSGAGEEGGDDDGAQPGKPKKSYGVQLALYTDLIGRAGMAAGRHAFIWDIHGEEVRYNLDEPFRKDGTTLWDLYLETRSAVRRLVDRETGADPALTSVCRQCVWRGACRRIIDQSDDLTLLPELGRAKRDALRTRVPNVHALAAADLRELLAPDGRKSLIKGIGPDSLRKLQARARLLIDPHARPFLTEPLPPLSGDPELFFDIETDPLRGRCYLHGIVVREGRQSRTERFVAFFADEVTDEAERAAFAEAIAFFRAHAPALLVHYSPYERTEYRRLQRKYPEVCTGEEIEALFASGRAFDLYHDGVKRRSEWPTHDYSIKTLAKFLGFRWRDADPSGAASIEWFHRWVETRDPAVRQRLLAYNEDDCRAMRVVLDEMRTMVVRREP
jgi:predicted RecB family nuclease